MFVDTTVTEIKKNRLTSTVVVEYVDPNIDFFITKEGTAIVRFDEHDGWNMHIKREQAVLLVEWAKNLVAAIDNHNIDEV